MSTGDRYPINVIEHVTMSELDAKRIRKAAEQIVQTDYQSPELVAIGGLEEWCKINNKPTSPVTSDLPEAASL